MEPPRPLLYTYRRCPYAMRARMALLVAGITFDAHEIVLREKPTEMLAVSPKGTVPVLVLPDHRVLEQSWDIVEWSLTREGTGTEAHGWWIRAQIPELHDLVHRNDGDFKRHLDRYKYPERFPQDTASTVTAGTRAFFREQAVAVLLERLESCLAGREFLGGAQPCAADIGIFPFVRQFAAVDPVWFDTLPLRRVRAWLNHWLQSSLFEACMQKLPSNAAVRYPGLAHSASGA